MAAGDPITSSDAWTVADYTTNKAMVRLVTNATQSLASGADVAINFATEDWDTIGAHDNTTNPSRITPNVAGYYKITGSLAMSSSALYNTIDVWIRKNGTTMIQPFVRTVEAQIAGIRVKQVSCTVTLNGGTDYIELMGRQTQTSGGAAVNTQASIGVFSVLEANFERPL